MCRACSGNYEDPDMSVWGEDGWGEVEGRYAGAWAYFVAACISLAFLTWLLSEGVPAVAPYVKWFIEKVLLRIF